MATGSDPGRAVGARLRARRRLAGAGLTAPFADDAAVACACGDAYGPDGEPPARPDRAGRGAGPAPSRMGVRQRRRRVPRRPLAAAAVSRGPRRLRGQGVGPALAGGGLRAAWSTRRWRSTTTTPTIRSRRSTPARAGRPRATPPFLEPRPARRPDSSSREWWSDTRWYDSAARARLSPRRAARLLGAYAGRRASAAESLSDPLDLRDRHGAASSCSSGTPRACADRNESLQVFSRSRRTR